MRKDNLNTLQESIKRLKALENLKNSTMNTLEGTHTRIELSPENINILGDAASESLALRILIQNNRIKDAEQVYNSIKNKKDYEKVFKKWKGIQNKPLWLFFYLKLVVLLVILIFVCLVVIKFLPGKTNETTLPDDLKKEDTVTSQLTGKDANLTVILPEIKVEGIISSYEEDKTKLTFNKGLFDKGIELNQNAKLLLNNLADQLKLHSNISITIFGCTDSIKINNALFKNNDELGMERAKIVYTYLKSRVNLPAMQISIGSKGEEKPPYSNSKKEHLKNRTVIIYISTFTNKNF